MAMRRASAMLPRSVGLGQLGSVRNASWASTRWVEKVRAASKATSVDDPPTKPLPERHELHEGESDFSRFVDRYPDVSVNSALAGFGTVMGLCYCIYYVSTNMAANSRPVFTLRELPTMAQDIPTYRPAVLTEDVDATADAEADAQEEEDDE